jgi:hypothetical protein
MSKQVINQLLEQLHHSLNIYWLVMMKNQAMMNPKALNTDRI